MEGSLQGLYVPLITPFTGEGDLAPDALERLAHAVLDGGATGLVALGTTGESATLTAAERRTVLDICAAACRERGATLVAGAGSNDTAGSRSPRRCSPSPTPWSSRAYCMPRARSPAPWCDCRSCPPAAIRCTPP
jgi:hypothetical protein